MQALILKVVELLATVGVKLVGDYIAKKEQDSEIAKQWYKFIKKTQLNSESAVLRDSASKQIQRLKELDKK